MNLLRLAIFVCGIAIIILSYIVYQQQLAINELYWEWMSIMEHLIEWLEEKGIQIPVTEQTEVQKKYGTGIVTIADGVEQHKISCKITIQKNGGCVPSVVAQTQKTEDGIGGTKNGLRKRIAFIFYWNTFFSRISSTHNKISRSNRKTRQ